MSTPIDEAIAAIAVDRYHNHRLEKHSDVVSKGMVRDLRKVCAPFDDDLRRGAIAIWENFRSPGDRERRVDLLVGEPSTDGLPDFNRIRLAVEHKSVVTAHRNRTNRFDDLTKVMKTLIDARPEVVLVATVLVGTAERVINVPDGVKKAHRNDLASFERIVLPRLSSGDERLFEDYNSAVSYNSPTDPQKTVDRLRELPTRGRAQTHVRGYDYVLLAPVFIDNVHPPSVPRPEALGIRIDDEYAACLSAMAAAYSARFH